MQHEARLVWEGGFPQGITLVVNEEYLASVKSLEVTANDHYGTIRVLLVQDGEYLSLREANEPESLTLFVSKEFEEGTVEWEEGILTCGFWIPSNANREEREIILLKKYVTFLSVAGVCHLTPDLVPEIEWLSDAP